jgi:hypothetical protein
MLPAETDVASLKMTISYQFGFAKWSCWPRKNPTTAARPELLEMVELLHKERIAP